MQFRIPQLLIFCGLGIVSLGLKSFAQETPPAFTDWPEETSIRGTVIVCREFDSESIATALRGSDTEQSLVVVTSAETPTQDFAQWLQSLTPQDASKTTVSLLLLADFSKQVDESLEQADVLLLSTEELPAWDARQTTKMSTALKQFVARRKTIVLAGAMAELAGQWSVSGKAGLNLVPSAVLAESLDKNLDVMLEKHPRTVGVALKSGQAMILSGRKIQLIGTGRLEFKIPGNQFLPVRQESIVAMSRRSGRRISEMLFDWTEWRRDSIDRTLSQFPAPNPPVPSVPKGRLVIVGGGGMPSGLMTDFVNWAGGPKNAKLVYIPCSERESLPARQQTLQQWKRMGVKSVTMLHTKDRNKANSDDEFLAPLKDATGIWFGGGRQWNFSDSWYGTQGHQLMKKVLERGGVIGGSSAGASIQGRYLARATPIENFRIMAPGYERGGLGFLPGVAIDQHFSQRGRQKDMTQLVNKYPQLLGIGIDEATALIVTDRQAKIVGQGSVYFYDRRSQLARDTPDFLAGTAGSTYDLESRQFITSPEPK